MIDTVVMGIPTDSRAWASAKEMKALAEAIQGGAYNALHEGDNDTAERLFREAGDAFDVCADAYEEANHGRLASSAAFWAQHSRKAAKRVAARDVEWVRSDPALMGPVVAA